MVKEKRKSDEARRVEEEAARKKAKLEEHVQFTHDTAALRDRALTMWIKEMDDGTMLLTRGLYGYQWQEGAMLEKQKLELLQVEERVRRAGEEENRRRTQVGEYVSLKGTGVFLDDYDPRY